MEQTDSSRLTGARQELLVWYAAHRRILPWREEPTPYRVWVSEIMLQQTQVSTVIPYFERWMRQFPDIKALACATEQDVLERWSGLGYYRRAKNLRRGAQKVADQGRLPSNIDEWLEVPGVGPYTAGAIASISQGIPAAIVDGNVERVVSRVLGLRRSQCGSERVYTRYLWAAAEAGVKEATQSGAYPGDYNQAMMELGARVCTPKNPSCERCPVSARCWALQTQSVASLPEAKPRPKTVVIKERCLLVMDTRGRVFLEQAGEGEWRAGLWDLPRIPLSEALKSWGSGLNALGQLQTRHVVTQHKIHRRTDVALWCGAIPPRLKSSRWVRLPKYWEEGAKLPVPIGSALKKTLLLARERFF